jgi:hypothetical protein
VVVVLLVENEELSSVVIGTREDRAVSLPSASGSPNGGKEGLDNPRLPDVRGAVNVEPDGDGAGNAAKNDGVVLGLETVEEESSVSKYAEERGTSFMGKDRLAIKQVFVETQLGNRLRNGKSDDV